ncbi:MAG: hypothetical protein QOJ14_893 [Thermoleophilaceae bacterium]|nr:hypothetical protein [Thermoleophilaceae bacterium]
MSRWLPASVALLLVLLVAQNADSTTRPPARCSATGSQTLYDDAEVRVFTREVTDYVERTVACSHLNGHRTKIAQDAGDSVNAYVEHITAPGGWLGYSVHIDGESTGTGKACVLRIRTGKRRCTRGLQVLGLGATRAGSVAWLAYEGVDSGGGTFCCQVYKRDAGAEDAVTLDQGPNINRDSFAVGGGHIYWMDAGQPRSATMP